jgi:hypothetical protein
MLMTEHGMHDDSAHREHEQHAAWGKHEAARVRAQNAKETQAMAEAAGRNKRKGRSRTNYMSLPDTDYHRIRRTDYYADQERDESILVMMNDDDHTMKWMSGANQCTATSHDFANALGFEFDGPNALGARFFNPRGPNKDSLCELYSCSALPFEKGRTPMLSATPWITDSTTVQNIVTIAIVSKL